MWLVGLMGAGKTTVGQRLAELLARPFVDTDVEIERAAGRSVAEIFAAEGEAGFRARERAAVDRAAAAGPRVVSLGGGAIAQPGMAERLGEAGTIVYLRARPATLVARVGEWEDRPLLRGLDAPGRLARLEALLRDRSRHYERAHIVVDVDDLDAHAVARLVLERLHAGAP